MIGEVRGPKISDLLMALNTGHEGGCGTVHANSASDVPARLEALGALGGLSRDVLHTQLAAALDTVVHITRKDGRRWVSMRAGEPHLRRENLPAIPFLQVPCEYRQPYNSGGVLFCCFDYFRIAFVYSV